MTLELVRLPNGNYAARDVPADAPEPTKVWIVQGDHPTVPGRPLIACATKDRAYVEAADLVRRMPGGRNAKKTNWQTVLERIQKKLGEDECDVWITEAEVLS